VFHIKWRHKISRSPGPGESLRSGDECLANPMASLRVFVWVLIFSMRTPILAVVVRSSAYVSLMCLRPRVAA